MLDIEYRHFVVGLLVVVGSLDVDLVDVVEYLHFLVGSLVVGLLDIEYFHFVGLLVVGYYVVERNTLNISSE